MTLMSKTKALPTRKKKVTAPKRKQKGTANKVTKKSAAPKRAKKTSAKPRTKRAEILEKRAMQLVQADGVSPLYQFSLTGEELHQLADISRVSRDKGGRLIGYQRAGVRKHVDGIADYIDGDRPLLPNPIILAFNDNVKFVGSRGPKVSDGYSTSGHLEIPIPEEEALKPAWIVDGQQRTLALGKCKRTNFAVPVIAFIAESVELQREQFLLINNSKPLPRGLVTELLPDVDAILPSKMLQNKAPSLLCELLNRHPHSPFLGLIKRPSMSRAEAKETVIRDTSVVDMLRDSLTNVSGCLFSYRNLATGEMDADGIRDLLLLYWGAVKETFPDAWGRNPRESRLMGGVGISAMGRLMDKVMGMVNPGARGAKQRIKKDLALIAPYCAWSSGRWEDMDGRAWDDLQNTPSHKRLLANHLIRMYSEAKRGA
jgi:DGQHR domain-containing protein